MAKSEGTTTIVKQGPTAGEKFTNLIIREFGSTVSDKVEMSPYQRHLARHLFVKIDATLRELENKRLASNQSGRQPIVWANINMQKLALDAVHRVDLGLDALIENHIHPIPYWNAKQGKYDLDLRIGYVGKDFYRRKMATDVPKAIIYELVYSTDKFKPIKRTLQNKVESYEFEIDEPFDRGEIIGGFGYIMFEDSSKNELVIVTAKDFQKSKSQAKTQDFWTKNPTEMCYKTLVLRVTAKLQIDPTKVNESYLAVEAADEERTEGEVAEEIAENANKNLLEITESEVTEEQPIETPKAKRDPSTIKTINQLMQDCKDDFSMDEKQVCKQLGVTSRNEITDTPANCYLQLAETHMGPETEEGPGF